MVAKHQTKNSESEPSNYELFILVLSVLSLVNIVLLVLPLDPIVHNVVVIVDFVYTAIFLGDFFTRLVRAKSKGAYFKHDGGWLDLLGSLPGLRIFRVFRIVRVGRGVRRTGLRGMWNSFVHQRAASALLTTILAGLIVLQYASMFVVAAEKHSPDANIKSASDAVWWAYVTMTTVGYGDRYPVTNAGRLVGVVLMTLGVGLFGVLTGFLATAFVGPKDETPHEDTPGGSEQAIKAASASPDITEVAAVTAPDISARVDALASQVSSLGKELQQLTQLLRNQAESRTPQEH
jgi:voltage-gated potassium channel Kch